VRGAAIAKSGRFLERAKPAVGLVDDHRFFPTQRLQRGLDVRLQGDGAIERLLDEQDLPPELLELSRSLDPLDQPEEIGRCLVLLVAVERDPERARAAGEHRGDRFEA
jgi:hypothetical protein